MNISKLLSGVLHARKRTGLILAKSKFSTVLEQAKQEGYNIVDSADWYDETILLTDDYLLSKLAEAGHDCPSIIINMETFVAPRLGDNFLENFGNKLVVAEPHYAVIVLLYSTTIYQKINSFYKSHPLTSHHSLSLLANDDMDSHD